MRGKFLMLLAVLLLTGCASTTVEHAEAEGVTAHGCADGHCWRTKDTHQYIGERGVLLPEEYQTERQDHGQ